MYPIAVTSKRQEIAGHVDKLLHEKAVLLNKVNNSGRKMALRGSTDGSSTINQGTSTNLFLTFGIVVFGCALVKRDWVPYALLLLAIGYGGFRVFSSGVQQTRRLRPVLKPMEFQSFRLQEKIKLSHNVAIYRFALPSSEAILGLPIGQHISLAATLPQPDGSHKEIVRSYTPISGDHQPGYFDLLIKSYPTGNISRHMATMIVGDELKVKGPKGAMVYTPNMVRCFGMIAGGTGITPMLQIIRAVIRGRASGDTTKIDLIFANVNEEDILLREDLDRLAAEDQGFCVHYVLNVPPEKWTGGVGFVTPEMMKNWLPAPAEDMKLLLCGPPPMIGAMKKAGESLGFEKARPVSRLEDQVFAF